MSLFYFVRHGETEWNAEGRLCGSTDVPLSDLGRRQAQLLARRFQPIAIEALYSSPLSRALETARLIGEVIGREPVIDPRLTELNYGSWESRIFAEVKRTDPIYRSWDADPAAVAPPEGETGIELLDRAWPFMADVAQRHPSGNVVVVCHKTVCRLLACHIMGVPLAEYRRRLPMQNAAVNILETAGQNWSVVALNDTSHLDSLRADHATAEGYL